MHNWPLLEVALSNWEDEGGARAQRMESEHVAQVEVPQSLGTESEHLRIRMIGMDTRLITMLAQAPDQQLELGIEMVAFIARRLGFTQQPRTVRPAKQRVHLLHRARHFQGSVEGHALS